MLSQPEREVPHNPIIVDAAAVLHEPLAKRPDLPTLLQDLRDVVVFMAETVLRAGNRPAPRGPL
jgi:hypothetical protein